MTPSISSLQPYRSLTLAISEKGSKAAKATSKTSTATPVEAGSLPSLTSAKRGKPKPRRADVDKVSTFVPGDRYKCSTIGTKLAVEEEEVVGVKESRHGKRKSDLDRWAVKLQRFPY